MCACALTVITVYGQPVLFALFIGSRALSFSGPLLSLSVDVCLWVRLYVRNFEVKYLGNQSS